MVLPKLTYEEAVALFQRFLDERGLFYDFKGWCLEQGYKIDQDMGMEDN